VSNALVTLSTERFVGFETVDIENLSNYSSNLSINII
jgi:hypothetical protein